MSLFGRIAALLSLSLLGLVPTSRAQTNVLTGHNDVGRTGLNPAETILTPANVTASSFGKLYSIPIDGQAYAQPLYMSSLAINGANHSVLFVATEHDTVTAYDTNAQGAVLWQADMKSTAHGAASGATSDPTSDTGCTDVQGPEYGIRGTPVIDSATNTLYTTARTLENGQVIWRIHAIDITTGNEKFGGPIVVTASVPGTAPDAVNGQVVFSPKWQNQRPGLLLLNGVVYTAWGAVCDFNTWHGWIMGYSAASGTLQQTTAFITTPNGSESGIWMVGSGLAADTENGVSRIFATTGNGTYDASQPYGTNTMDYGDDILALTQSSTGGLTVSDEFTPRDQQYLENNDVDLGSGGLVVLPDNLPGSSYPHQAVQIGKSGNIFLLNRDNLGGYSPNVNGALQEVDDSGLWGTPGYWNGNLYFWPSQSNLRQYSITNGLLSTAPIAQGSVTRVTNTGHPFLGTTVSISSNGNTNPIVWADDYVSWAASTVPVQYLYAFDGTNVANLLWSSNQFPSRNSAGAAQKYAVPTIADGRVYLASAGYIMVYGLLPPDFALSVPQSSVVLPPTSSANLPITINNFGGFTGAVTLTVSGLPTGVAASITNNVLVLSASATAPPSTTAITLTGVSGTLTHSITIFVSLVAGGQYSTPVDLSSSYNVWAIQNDGVSPLGVGIDGSGYALSEKLLGSVVSSNGVAYTLGAPGVADAVSGTTVAIPATGAAYTAFNFIASAGGGASQVFTLNYTDGSTSTLTQSLSNWGYPSNYAGETKALSTAYRITPNGTSQTGPWYVYSYSAPITAGKVLSSVALPGNGNVVMLAASLSYTAPTTQTITFNSIAAQPVNGSINLTAIASSGLAVFYTSSTTGVCSVSGSTVAMVATGTCTITASQAGNSSYAAATPVAQSFSVAQAQTITFSAIANQVVGVALTLNATASSGLAISYTSSTTSVCTVSGSTATMVVAGTCSITASQAGNGSYAAATPVTQTFAVTSNVTTPVNLSSVDNIWAISNNGTAPTNGGFDSATSVNAYSETLLGSSLRALGVPFQLGAAGVADAVSSVTVPLPAGNYTSLDFLGAAGNGNQPSQSFVVTYTDGTTSTFTQSMSDWYTPQNYSGESIASTMAYRINANGSLDNRTFYLYAYSLPLNGSKTVQSLTLPNNRNTVMFAMTLAGS